MELWNKRYVIAPSLISCADFLHLEQSIQAMERAGVEALHIDILDGHFSPSMPIGFDTVKAVRQITNLPFDCHVMCQSNAYFIDELLKIGVQQITFHAETEQHIDHQLNYLHAAGIRAGLALKPATPLSVLEYTLEKCDAVLLMLMNPGYAGSASETQVPYAARKISELHHLISESGTNTSVILDGRISREDLRRFGAEANFFVCGSTCLKKDNLESSIKVLKHYCNSLG